MRLVRNIMSIFLLSLFLAACSSSPLENKKGLAVSAYFGDSEDWGSDLSLQELWIFNSESGELVHNASWNDSRTLASNFLSLPQGSYMLVLGANLDQPLEIQGSESAQTLAFSLDEASPFKVFSASTELNNYVPSRIVNVDMTLNRVMAELTVELQGAPQDLELAIEAVNCAEAFFPAKKNDAGQWGLPSDNIRSITTSPMGLDSSLRSPIISLMPTASGREWSFFHLTMTTAEGIVLETFIEAPRMDAGAKYLMSLKYQEIQAFMHLSTCPISDWTEGWVYEGDIPNPVN